MAKDLRISESCLRNWMAQADVDESGSDTQLTSKEKKEVCTNKPVRADYLDTVVWDHVTTLLTDPAQTRP